MDVVDCCVIARVAYYIVLTGLCVYGLHRLFLVSLFLRVRTRLPQPGSRFAEWPYVTVQLPMFNEAAVARRVIEAAGAIDYPRDRLQIQVLDDSVDETTRIATDAVESLRLRGVDAEYLHRTDRTGFKAGALEAGTKSAKGEFIAIFDADFIPPPGILKDAIHHFMDPHVGAVQTRWEHLNRRDSLLTSAQAILLDGHFLIEHTARNRTGRFMSFNGTAGIWRRSAIESAGGWQHDTLTEDLDLSYRAQLAGWSIVFRPDITAPAELPPEMVGFKAQQHRWTKGGAQTCRKMLGSVFAHKVPLRVKVEALFHLTSGVAYCLMVLLAILFGPALFAHAVAPLQLPGIGAIEAILFALGFGSATVFYVASQRELRERWSSIFWRLPALLAVGTGITLNNAVAALQGFFGSVGEFERTPKYGNGPKSDQTIAPRTSASARKRRGRLWQAGFELLLASQLAGWFVFILFVTGWNLVAATALPFVVMFVFGFSYVAISTIGALMERRTAAQSSLA
ncbi:MAG: glycosyltransferase [Phycisphaerae bacterium]